MDRNPGLSHKTLFGQKAGGGDSIICVQLSKKTHVAPIRCEKTLVPADLQDLYSNSLYKEGLKAYENIKKDLRPMSDEEIRMLHKTPTTQQLRKMRLDSEGPLIQGCSMVGGSKVYNRGSQTIVGFENGEVQIARASNSGNPCQAYQSEQDFFKKSSQSGSESWLIAAADCFRSLSYKNGRVKDAGDKPSATNK